MHPRRHGYFVGECRCLDCWDWRRALQRAETSVEGYMGQKKGNGRLSGLVGLKKKRVDADELLRRK